MGAHITSFAIRPTRPDELDEVMGIYAHARAFMARNGNPLQWGPTGWPPRELVEHDVEQRSSYVAVDARGRIAAVFYYTFGEDVDPCYRVIDGAWGDPGPYGVVHRIASAHVARGAGRACITWAMERAGHLRIDTHPDNAPMRGLLLSLGFEQRGIIHVEEDDMPRLAFEWSAPRGAIAGGRSC